jgi:RHS repeat-associated protein
VYTYNKNNRLKTVTVAGNLKATYTYDAREQLAIRVLTNMTPSGTIHSVYDRQGNLLMESNGLTTGITREYIWLPETNIAPAMGATAPVDMPLAVVDAVNTATPATYFVHTDHLNRPVRMTNAAKAAVWQAVWKPFGEAQAITGAASLDARFPGQWFQIESGLAYNWHRHYDATTGRYTQADPLGFVDGSGVYGYAGQGPIASVDHSGRATFKNYCSKPVVVGGGVGSGQGHSGGSYCQVAVPPGGEVSDKRPFPAPQCGGALSDVDALDFDGDGEAKEPQSMWDMCPFSGGEKWWGTDKGPQCTARDNGNGGCIVSCGLFTIGSR